MGREGLRVARCRVGRLMRELGLAGAVRGRAWVTTTQTRSDGDPPARIWWTGTSPRRGRISSGSRTSRTSRPGAASSTSPSSSTSSRAGSWAGASRRRCGPTSSSMRSTKRSTIGAATDVGDLVHHSDRGSQYLAMRYTERLADAGIEPSVGSRGDSYDNALAESVIGLFKTEVIRRRDRGAISRPSNSPRSTGSIGSIIAGCSNRLATCRRPSTRRATMSRPQWPDSH